MYIYVPDRSKHVPWHAWLIELVALFLHKLDLPYVTRAKTCKLQEINFLGKKEHFWR